MNPQPNRQSVIKMVRVMAKITDRTSSKNVLPDESDVTETALEKSGVIREEFISVV